MRLIRVQFQGTEYSIKKNLFAQKLARLAQCQPEIICYDDVYWLPFNRITQETFQRCIKGEMPTDMRKFLEVAVAQFGRNKERRQLLSELVDRKECFQVNFPDKVFYLRKSRFLEILACVPGISTDMSNEDIANLTIYTLDSDELKECIRGTQPGNIRTFLHEAIQQILDNDRARAKLNKLIENVTEKRAKKEIYNKTFPVEFQGKQYLVRQGIYEVLANIDGVNEETTDEEFMVLATRIPREHLRYFVCGEQPQDLKTFIKAVVKEFLKNEGRRKLLDERIQRNRGVEEYLDRFVNDLDDLGMFSDSDNPFE